MSRTRWKLFELQIFQLTGSWFLGFGECCLNALIEKQEIFLAFSYSLLLNTGVEVKIPKRQSRIQTRCWSNESPVEAELLARSSFRDDYISCFEKNCWY